MINYLYSVWPKKAPGTFAGQKCTRRYRLKMPQKRRKKPPAGPDVFLIVDDSRDRFCATRVIVFSSYSANLDGETFMSRGQVAFFPYDIFDSSSDLTIIP